jgi:hypothetical protein
VLHAASDKIAKTNKHFFINFLFKKKIGQLQKTKKRILPFAFYGLAI